jgi:hypothetical protein
MAEQECRMVAFQEILQTGSRFQRIGTMALDWSCGALAEGLRCYRNEEFFLAHEHWEGIWLRCEEPEKTFLQALIQVTAAFHHLQRNNVIGSASLLRAALRRLDPFPAAYGGIAVERLRENIRAWLVALDGDGTSRPSSLPLIGCVATDCASRVSSAIDRIR